MLPSGDENTLQLTVAAVGPVSVAIDAGQNTFQLYESGNPQKPVLVQSYLHAACTAALTARKCAQPLEED